MGLDDESSVSSKDPTASSSPAVGAIKRIVAGEDVSVESRSCSTEGARSTTPVEAMRNAFSIGAVNVEEYSTSASQSLHSDDSSGEDEDEGERAVFTQQTNPQRLLLDDEEAHAPALLSGPSRAKPSPGSATTDGVELTARHMKQTKHRRLSRDERQRRETLSPAAARFYNSHQHRKPSRETIAANSPRAPDSQQQQQQQQAPPAAMHFSAPDSPEIDPRADLSGDNHAAEEEESGDDDMWSDAQKLRQRRRPSKASVQDAHARFTAIVMQGEWCKCERTSINDLAHLPRLPHLTHLALPLSSPLLSLSKAMENQERVGSYTSKKPCICNEANSKRLMCWDMWILVLLAYTALATPIQIAFTKPFEASADMLSTGSSSEYFLRIPPLVWFMADRVVDLSFFFDIVFAFHIAFIRKDGVLVKSRHTIALRYIRGMFFTDVIATIPYDLIMAMPSLATNSYEGVLRLPKMLRMLRIAKMIKVMKFQRLWRRWEPVVVTHVKYGVIRMISFGLIVFIVVHWMACGWFLLHVLMVSDDGEEDPLLASSTSPSHQTQTLTWVTQLPGVWEDSEWRLEELYIAALYWSVMTLTTIGYGDINPKTTPERAYVIFAMLVGAGLFSFILSEMGILIAALSHRSSQFKSTVDRLTTCTSSI